MSAVKEVLGLIKENNIDHVDFRFTDSKGKFHHITHMSSHVDEQTLILGVGFDGSSIEGWKDINESDMLLIPDLSTAHIDVFTEAPCLILICNVVDPVTGEGYEKDPRTVAMRAEKYIRQSKVGDEVYFGPEAEFFVFDDVRFENSPNKVMHKLDSEEGPHNCNKQYPYGNTGHRPNYKGGYFPVQPVDSSFDLRCEIVSTLKEFGIIPTLHHHEVAAAQVEVGFEYSTLVKSADNVQKFKYVVHNIAHNHGKTATFMPKPVFGDNGSGMHTHQSIWRDGQPLFFEKGGYADLSEMALYYIGGIIKHAKALNAFSNPSTNSYKRLVHGFEAPVQLAYSARNRSAAIRIPFAHSDKAKRIEARFPDPTANPYLAFSAMLMAGIDGIKNKIHPGEAIDKNLYNLSKEDELKIPMVARSLREALDSLDSDREFLKEGGVFSDSLIDSYIKLKMQEVKAWEMAPHPIEFKMYYSS